MDKDVAAAGLAEVVVGTVSLRMWTRSALWWLVVATVVFGLWWLESSRQEAGQCGV